MPSLSTTQHISLDVRAPEVEYVPQLFSRLGSLFNLSKQAAFFLWQDVFLPFCRWGNRRGRRQREDFSIHHRAVLGKLVRQKLLDTHVRTHSLTHVPAGRVWKSRMWLEVNSEVCKAKEEVAATMRHMMKRTGSDSDNGGGEGGVGEGGGGGG